VGRGQAPGVGGFSPKISFVGGQAVGFQLHLVAFGILPDEKEIPQVSHQHLAVFAPVAGDLLAVGGKPGVVAGGLYLNDPPGPGPCRGAVRRRTSGTGQG
jgi:hypothetical protein